MVYEQVSTLSTKRKFVKYKLEIISFLYFSIILPISSQKEPAFLSGT